MQILYCIMRYILIDDTSWCLDIWEDSCRQKASADHTYGGTSGKKRHNNYNRQKHMVYFLHWMYEPDPKFVEIYIKKVTLTWFCRKTDDNTAASRLYPHKVPIPSSFFPQPTTQPTHPATGHAAWRKQSCKHLVRGADTHLAGLNIQKQFNLQCHVYFQLEMSIYHCFSFWYLGFGYWRILGINLTPLLFKILMFLFCFFKNLILNLSFSYF